MFHQEYGIPFFSFFSLVCSSSYRILMLRLVIISPHFLSFFSMIQLNVGCGREPLDTRKPFGEPWVNKYE